MRNILIACLTLLLVNCATENDGSTDASVVIEATGLDADRLTGNNTATFSAEIQDYEGDISSLT